MNLTDLSVWPVTLAQADNSPAPSAPGIAPADTSPAPAAGGDAGGSAGDAAGTTGADGTTGDGQAQTPGNPLGGILFPMILILGVLFIFSMSGGRKEKKRRAELLANLTKGAKVQTAGGVLGTVVEVRDDEVLVKVDENSNTRMRFAKTAISSVISED